MCSVRLWLGLFRLQTWNFKIAGFMFKVDNLDSFFHGVCRSVLPSAGDPRSLYWPARVISLVRSVILWPISTWACVNLVMFNNAFLSVSLHPATALRNRVSAAYASVLTTYTFGNLSNTEIWAMLGVYKHFSALLLPRSARHVVSQGIYNLWN